MFEVREGKVEGQRGRREEGGKLDPDRQGGGGWAVGQASFPRGDARKEM